MITELSYKNKFELLCGLENSIVQSVKKDIKSEMNQKGSLVETKLFEGKRFSGVSLEEMLTRCSSKLQEDEELAEWVASRWVFKHAEIYQFYSEELSKINPNFDEIASLDPAVEQQLVAESERLFGALNTYVFCVLNSVVLSEASYQRLKSDSLASLKSSCKEELPMSIDELRKKHELEILRITDRYEKKIQGLLRKYQVDIEGYKKQVSALQKKIGSR